VQIELRGVSHYYGDRLGGRVFPLRNINFSISTGERAIILGPSGSGKSTLLFVLGCLLRPVRGEVMLDGQPLSKKSEEELALFRNSQIGFVFQRCYLVPTLTVTENILLPLWIQGRQRTKNHKLASRVKELLEQLDLTERGHFLPHMLSGGQRRRVALARALINDPEIILADEPTAELDVAKKTKIGQWILEQANRGKIVVIATHDPSLVTMGSRSYDLRNGQMYAQDSTRWNYSGAGAKAKSI